MTHSLAEQAGNATPENDEAGHRTNGAGLLDQSTHPDSAALVARDQEKLFTNLRALLALKGYSLSRTDARDGKPAYFVSKWQYLRELSTLDQVADFLGRVGGAE